MKMITAALCLGLLAGARAQPGVDVAQERRAMATMSRLPAYGGPLEVSGSVTVADAAGPHTLMLGFDLLGAQAPSPPTPRRSAGEPDLRPNSQGPPGAHARASRIACRRRARAAG